MKFAKELEEDLVPEWRIKYFNYKVGKKKVKAVSRALRAANRTPQVGGRHNNDSTEELPYTHYDFNQRHSATPGTDTSQPKNGAAVQPQATSTGVDTTPNRPSGGLDRRESLTMFARSPPAPAAESHLQELSNVEETDSDPSSDSDHHSNDEERPLQKYSNGTVQGRPRYGSIVGSPPSEPLSALHLPDPALDPTKAKPPTVRGSTADAAQGSSPNPARITRTSTAPFGSLDKQKGRKTMGSLPSLSRRLFKKRAEQSDDLLGSKAKVKRAFTSLTLDSPAVSDSQFEAFRELDARQDEFFTFLDKELDKVESFYKMKENEASSRLGVLREQLHEMRDRRLEDLRIAKSGGKIADKGLLDGQIPIMSHVHHQKGALGSFNKNLIDPMASMFHSNGTIGKTSKAREELASPQLNGRKDSGAQRDRGDYVRKKQPHEKVPYRSAKRKLKLALQEFYRGLELLKSYALLNRTAFRKINKKYDKAVMARPPLRYMAEKVNTAHFVQSTLVEETLVQIEDLYARYFERGNRKVAINKLRSHLRQGAHSSVSFRNGLYVAAGVGLAVSGMADGIPFLFSENTVTKDTTSYLFQLYGGYFLAVLLFLYFVIDCRIWTRNRVNYVFVFEYDTRHVLDWRQLSELPCFFLFLNGFFLWLNFRFDEKHAMYIYWPVVLIGITVLIVFLPFKILYYTARKWWLYSNWRLLLAGLYPVEFRDFFLGDMYCSETYALSQMEVFFCLYVNRWNEPAQCNSTHSRLLGFLTTLPPIWRAFQCLRRYYDSRNWFPHLANFVKYLGNIMYYMTLSLYRINMTGQMKALFISFALLNGLYCSFWDVFMDFSLGNPWSKNFMLRDNLAFRQKRIYYVVMILDVVLRQQWILYVIFTEDLHHSALVNFFVALIEVTRRGVWSLFRVENEHCNNVVQFRASRDVPLPYSVSASRAGSMDVPRQEDRTQTEQREAPQSPKTSRRSEDQATSNDLERADTTSSTVRSRNPFSQSTPGLRALQRVGTVIAAAHSQDFQKKYRPEVVGRTSETEANSRAESDDEEDDDEDHFVTGTSVDATNRAMEREWRLDSREDVRQQRHSRDDYDQIGPDDMPEEAEQSSASGSASGSGDRSGHQTRSRIRSERQERDASALRRADAENEAEIEEARERIDAARGPA